LKIFRTRVRLPPPPPFYTLQKLNTKFIIEKLVIRDPSKIGPFWAKQTKLARRLLEKYPDSEFWTKVDFPRKYEDLLYLMGEKGDKLIKSLQRQFYYKNPTHTIEYIEGPAMRGRKKKIEKPRKRIIDFDK